LPASSKNTTRQALAWLIAPHMTKRKFSENGFLLHDWFADRESTST
jgi:hypothetical protein